MGDYIAFKLLKLLGFVVVAFIWGFFCEWTGRELNGQRKKE